MAQCQIVKNDDHYGEMIRIDCHGLCDGINQDFTYSSGDLHVAHKPSTERDPKNDT